MSLGVHGFLYRSMDGWLNEWRTHTHTHTCPYIQGEFSSIVYVRIDITRARQAKASQAKRSQATTSQANGFGTFWRGRGSADHVLFDLCLVYIDAPRHDEFMRVYSAWRVSVRIVGPSPSNPHGLTIYSPHIPTTTN